MTRLALLLCLLTLSFQVSAGNLLRLHVYHGRGPRGVPTQTITVFFWPEPKDAELHLVAVAGDYLRASSVPLQGLETRRRAHVFEWRLPPSLIPGSDEPPIPYTVTAVILNKDGEQTNSVSTQFYVTRVDPFRVRRH